MLKYLVRNDLSFFGINVSLNFKTELEALIKKHCLADVEVVYIDYEHQSNQLNHIFKNYSNSIIVSFDKLIYPHTPYGMQFNISRVFNKNIQNSPIGFIHDDFDVLNRNIENLLNTKNIKSLICYDDDTASGNTKRYIESKLNYECSWIFGNELSIIENVYDVIDLRDFVLENNVSGLYIMEFQNTLSRKSYVSDSVDLVLRAKLRNEFKKEFLELKERYFNGFFNLK